MTALEEGSWQRGPPREKSFTPGGHMKNSKAFHKKMATLKRLLVKKNNICFHLRSFLLRNYSTYPTDTKQI